MDGSVNKGSWEVDSGNLNRDKIVKLKKKILMLCLKEIFNQFKG